MPVRKTFAAEICAVISNKVEASVYNAAKGHILHNVFWCKNYADNQAMDHAIGNYIEDLGADLIVFRCHENS